MDNVTLETYQEPKLMLGAIGAVAAGTVGMLAWYWLIRLTNYEIGYAAWGVGLLTGFGARTLAKGGNFPLGIAAATCALLAVIGGQYLAFNYQVDTHIAQSAATIATTRMEFAQRAVKAETDEQLRVLAAEYLSEEDAPITPAQVTDDQFKEFKEDSLPDLRDFAAGKPPRTEFEQNVAKFIKATIPIQTLLKESVGLWTILWLFLGVSSAYKLAAAGN